MVSDGVCPLCGSVTVHPLTPEGWRGGQFNYVRCTSCMLGRLHPMPAGTEAESYDEGYFVNGGGRAGYVDYEADEAQHCRTAKLRMKRVSSALEVPAGSSKRLIDVGTATGFLPQEARCQGWDVAAVEVSPWARERARARGIRTESSLADLSDLRGQVDVVTFFQVLEHIPDPTAALRQAAELLRPGGVVVCETWDLASRTARWSGSRWQQLSAPSVLWLFDPDSARHMVNSVGLTPVSWQRSPKAVSLATVMGQLLGDASSGLAGALVPLTSRVPIPYPLDDLVTFVAHRAGGQEG